MTQTPPPHAPHTASIMEHIHKQKITPRSRFAVRWKNVILWGAVACIVVCGALFTSLIVMNVVDVHPMLVQRLGWGGVGVLLWRTAPWLWLLLALAVVLVGFVVVRLTRWGYRYSVVAIVGLTVLGMGLLGVILHMTEMNRLMGQMMMGGNGMQRMRVLFPEHGRWNSPHDGMLGGRIIAMERTQNGVMTLRAFDDTMWRVVITEETSLPRRRALGVGMDVEMIGTVTGIQTYVAEMIRPFPLSRLRDCAATSCGNMLRK